MAPADAGAIFPVTGLEVQSETFFKASQHAADQHLAQLGRHAS